MSGEVPDTADSAMQPWMGAAGTPMSYRIFCAGTRHPTGKLIASASCSSRTAWKATEYIATLQSSMCWATCSTGRYGHQGLVRTFSGCKECISTHHDTAPTDLKDESGHTSIQEHKDLVGVSRVVRGPGKQVEGWVQPTTPAQQQAAVPAYIFKIPVWAVCRVGLTKRSVGSSAAAVVPSTVSRVCKPRCLQCQHKQHHSPSRHVHCLGIQQLGWTRTCVCTM
jgi:hypothetical protein